MRLRHDSRAFRNRSPPQWEPVPPRRYATSHGNGILPPEARGGVTVARGRKPQSRQGFLCSPAAHVADMSGTFRETANHAIPISWMVVDGVLRNRSPENRIPCLSGK